jgi:hypothetical protein
MNMASNKTNWFLLWRKQNATVAAVYGRRNSPLASIVV